MILRRLRSEVAVLSLKVEELEGELAAMPKDIPWQGCLNERTRDEILSGSHPEVHYDLVAPRCRPGDRINLDDGVWIEVEAVGSVPVGTIPHYVLMYSRPYCHRVYLPTHNQFTRPDNATI